MVLSERNQELKVSLGLKDEFFVKRHGEKKELVILRQKNAVELAGLRDKIAEKRHKERIQILDTKFSHLIKNMD